MNVLIRTLAAIGATISLGAAIFVGFWFQNSGWMERITPKPAAPAIQVRGAPIVVAGRRAYFHVETRGRVGVPQWKLIPPMPGALLIAGDGRSAEFLSDDEGMFVIQVSIAGDGLQVASDFVEFENLPLKSDQPAAVAAMPLAEEPIPTVAELTQVALSEIQSDDRASEARIVAGCFRTMIGRIQTGLIAPDADVMAEIDDSVRIALGDRANGWASFLSTVNVMIETLKDQGAITTAASAEAALQEISGVLQTAR